jgi:hypothetical protein
MSRKCLCESRVTGLPWNDFMSAGPQLGVCASNAR